MRAAAGTRGPPRQTPGKVPVPCVITLLMHTCQSTPHQASRHVYARSLARPVGLSVCHTCTIAALHFFLNPQELAETQPDAPTSTSVAGLHATFAPQQQQRRRRRLRGSPECAGLGTWQRQGRSVQPSQLGQSSPEEHALVGTIRRPRLRPFEPRRVSLLGGEPCFSSWQPHGLPAPDSIFD